MRSFFSVLSLFLVLSGCNVPRYDTPQSAYRSFHRLVQKGEAQKAYDVLSQATRERLAARAQRVSEASQGAVARDPVALFFASTPTPPELKEVGLLRESGDVAVLRVITPQETSEVQMVREPQGWRVNLLAHLETVSAEAKPGAQPRE